jgi:hypothetical protein
LCAQVALFRSNPTAAEPSGPRSLHTFEVDTVQALNFAPPAAAANLSFASLAGVAMLARPVRAAVSYDGRPVWLLRCSPAPVPQPCGGSVATIDLGSAPSLAGRAVYFAVQHNTSAGVALWIDGGGGSWVRSTDDGFKSPVRPRSVAASS